jgi:hypothetical protein
MRAVEIHRLELEQLESEYDFDKYAQMRYARLALVSVLRKLQVDKTISDYSMKFHGGKWKISYHSGSFVEPWDPSKMKIRLLQRHGEEFMEQYLDEPGSEDDNR